MIDERSAQLERMLQSGVIAVMRGVEGRTVVPAAEALVEGGVTTLEVTADTPGAAESMERLAETFASEDVVVGAGTVLDAQTARTMLLAGAEFIVSPTFEPDVVETANRAGVPVIPGIMTPTEALDAYEAGADAVKLFPARTVGPDHLAALRGPLEQLTVIPTGGIDRDNAAAFLRAGAAAIGIGSALVSDEIAAEEDWEALTERAEAFAALVAEHRD